MRKIFKIGVFLIIALTGFNQLFCLDAREPLFTCFHFGPSPGNEREDEENEEVPEQIEEENTTKHIA